MSITKFDLDTLEERLGKKIDESIEKLAVITARGFEHVNLRLDKVEDRLDNVEDRLDTIDNKLEIIDSRLDGIDDRLDKIENNTSHQLDRLTDSMRIVKTKLGLA